MESERYDAGLRDSMEKLEGTLAMLAIQHKDAPKWKKLYHQVAPWKEYTDWAAVYQRWKWLWDNPDQFEAAAKTDDFKENRDVAVFEMGVLFGIEYEQAYPTGRNDEWPIEVDERPAENL